MSEDTLKKDTENFVKLYKEFSGKIVFLGSRTEFQSGSPTSFTGGGLSDELSDYDFLSMAALLLDRVIDKLPNKEREECKEAFNFIEHKTVGISARKHEGH